MTPEEFWAILHTEPKAETPVHRLYYNEAGKPVCYSMEQLPGNYIEVDAETFAIGSHNVYVIDGKLKHITTRSTEKLMPSNSGTPCHPQDVSVIVSPDAQHTFWKKEINV